MITSSFKDHAQKALIIKSPMLCHGTKNLINEEQEAFWCLAF